MKHTLSTIPGINTYKIKGLVLAGLLFSVLASAQQYYPAGLGNTNLKLWLTAADTTTLLTTAGTPAASGNAVAKWKDKSGMGADAVQATGTAQPVYTANAMNGLGALIFQNTNQYLTGPSGSYKTIVSARAISGTTGGTNYHYLFSSPANSDFSIRNSGGGPGSNAVAYTDGPNVNDWCYNTGSPSTQWINGTQSLTGSTSKHILVDAAAGVTSNTYSISSSFMSRGMFGNDPVYELMAYNTTLSTTQRRLLENYEAAEWGMTASLPSSGYAVFTPPAASTYNKNLVGIGYTSSTDNFLANPAGSTDGLAFSSVSTAAGFLNTAGYIMAAHNAQANTIISNASIPGISGSNISRWNRSWNLQKTGGNSTGQLSVIFNYSDYNGTTAITTTSYALLYNATDGSFATGTNKLASTAATISGNTVSFSINAANLLNGYYTIVYSTTSLLPVHFTFFTASTDNDKSKLTWSVADETANSIYRVQRSADGSSFAAIGTVTGNATNASTYSFIDAEPAIGTNYYRIQLTEPSGKTIYSDTKMIKLNNSIQATVSVYPNPATDILHIVTHSNGSNVQKSFVQIINTTGQAVTAAIAIPASGLIDIPVTQLSKAIYLLQINQNGVSSLVKILKN